MFRCLTGLQHGKKKKKKKEEKENRTKHSVFFTVSRQPIAISYAAVLIGNEVGFRPKQMRKGKKKKLKKKTSSLFSLQYEKKLEKKKKKKKKSHLVTSRHASICQL